MANVIHHANVVNLHLAITRQDVPEAVPLFLPVLLTPGLGAVRGELLQSLYELIQVLRDKLLVVLIGELQHESNGLASVDPEVDIRGEEKTRELSDGGVGQSVGLAV